MAPMVLSNVPAVLALAALALVLVTGCSLGSGGAPPTASPTRASDFRPAQIRQAVVLVRVIVSPTSRVSERERRDLPALYESALLEALDARAILVRDIRSVDAAGSVTLDASAAAARAREMGVDHALVVTLRVEPAVVRVCEDTPRPLRGEAIVWRQQARVVRAADGGERVRAEVTTLDVEAECDGPRPSAQRRGVQATTTAAVEQLLGKILAR
jgi:hypothetical protein